MNARTMRLSAAQSDALGALLLLTERNCLERTGLLFPFVCSVAREHGVPILRIGRKRGVSAAAFLAALEEASKVEPKPVATANLPDGQQRAVMLRELGLREIGGVA